MLLHTAPFLLAFVISMAVNFVVSARMKMRYDVLLSSLASIGNMLDLYSWCIHEKNDLFPVDEQMKTGWEKLSEDLYR